MIEEKGQEIEGEEKGMSQKKENDIEERADAR